MEDDETRDTAGPLEEQGIGQTPAFERGDNRQQETSNTQSNKEPVAYEEDVESGEHSLGVSYKLTPEEIVMEKLHQLYGSEEQPTALPDNQIDLPSTFPSIFSTTTLAELLEHERATKCRGAGDIVASLAEDYAATAAQPPSRYTFFMQDLKYTLQTLPEVDVKKYGAFEDLPELLRIPENSRASYRKRLTSPVCQLLLEDTFWYTHCGLAHPDTSYAEQAALHRRIAERYAKLCMHYPPGKFGGFHRRLPYMLAMAVWLVYQRLITDAKKTLGLEDKKYVFCKVVRLFSGTPQGHQDHSAVHLKLFGEALDYHTPRHTDGSVDKPSSKPAANQQQHATEATSGLEPVRPAAVRHVTTAGPDQSAAARGENRTRRHYNPKEDSVYARHGLAVAKLSSIRLPLHETACTQFSKRSTTTTQLDVYTTSPLIQQFLQDEPRHGEGPHHRSMRRTVPLPPSVLAAQRATRPEYLRRSPRSRKRMQDEMIERYREGQYRAREERKKLAEALQQVKLENQSAIREWMARGEEALAQQSLAIMQEQREKEKRLQKLLESIEVAEEVAEMAVAATKCDAAALSQAFHPNSPYPTKPKLMKISAAFQLKEEFTQPMRRALEAVSATLAHAEERASDL